MKKRPLIGVSGNLIVQNGETYYRLTRHYLGSIQRAGGAPFPLPILRTRTEAKEYLDRLDGLVLTGGADLRPTRWGERKHPKATLLHPDRERSDYLVIDEALRRKLPTLAICLGSQEVNVACGGSLHQHMPDVPGISPAHRKSVSRHTIELTPGTRTREILGVRRLEVNSFHHQAVNRVGRGLRVTAVAPDGIIEGLESTNDHFLVAVQWHPERLQNRAPHRRLFSALVAETRRV